MDTVQQIHLDTFVAGVAAMLHFEKLAHNSSHYTIRYYSYLETYDMTNIIQSCILNAPSAEKYKIIQNLTQQTTPKSFVESIASLNNYYPNKEGYVPYLDQYYKKAKENYNKWKSLMREDAKLPIIEEVNTLTFTLGEQFYTLSPTKQQQLTKTYWQKVEEVRVAVLEDWYQTIEPLKELARPYPHKQQLIALQERIKRAQDDDNELGISDINTRVNRFIQAPSIQPLLDQIEVTKAFLAKLTKEELSYLNTTYEQELADLERIAVLDYRDEESVQYRVELLQDWVQNYTQRLENRIK